MKKTLLLLLLATCMLTGCITYTAKNGLENIQIPQKSETTLETRYALIKADQDKKVAERVALAKAQADALAKADAEAKAQQKMDEEKKAATDAEKSKANEKVAQFNAEIESIAERNDFPSDITKMSFPHVYRPRGSKENLDAAFSSFSVLFIPLGQTDLDRKVISEVVASISDIDVPFVAFTGTLANRVEFAKQYKHDAVIFKDGALAFSLTLKEAKEGNASFDAGGGKTLSFASLALPDEAFMQKDIDASGWNNALKTKGDKRIALFDAQEKLITDNARIIALSPDEPSTLDWTAFTPYSYRKDLSWPLSDHILSLGYSDTFRATHFSEEVNGGITRENGKMKERLDFLYTKGLMEVESERIMLSGLSDSKTPSFGLIATYIIP